MVNARKHGMFNQHSNKQRQHNKRINALTTFARKPFRAVARNVSGYAGCYVWSVLKKINLGVCLLFIVSCASTPENKTIESAVVQSPADKGYVKLSFDIDESGNPINIKILDASPKQVFDRSAIKALTKWKYKPKFVDGVAVVQKDLEVRLDFKLDEPSDDKL